MEKSQLDNLFPQTPSSKFSTKKGRSGYEPSDTETEWQEIPRHERGRNNTTLGPEAATLPSKSTLTLHRRYPSRFEYEVSSSSTGSVPGQPRRRHLSKSPYRIRIAEDQGDDDDYNALLSYTTGLNSHRNISPLPRPDLGRTVSPCNRNHEQKSPSRENKKAGSGLLEVGRLSEKAIYRRAVTAPRLRVQQSNHGKTLQNGVRTTKDVVLKQREASPFKAPSVGEINEMIAQVKLSKNPTDDYSSALESTDSIQPGDLFFSRECNALQVKNSSLPKNIQQYGYISPRPVVTTINPNRIPSESDNLNMNMPRTSSSNVLSRTTERRPIDESSFIEKAIVVESIPQFWADKHQPASLNGFICNKQEAQLLKELVSQGSYPHILLKGLSGSGKRELAMALLREIYGDACCNLSHDLRHFPIQDKRAMKVSVPITSSSHHMELNVNLEPNAKYALMGLIKEISNTYAITPEISNINFKSDYKVIILYEVDKAVENIQHMIKWIIDRYSDICKLVLCCEDDENIIGLSIRGKFQMLLLDFVNPKLILLVMNQCLFNCWSELLHIHFASPEPQLLPAPAFEF